ncbi:MAG: BatA domain-containing protein [Nonlabens sp.]
MVFKHPAVLYGLFFLVIPILVHLFQLRKFSRVDFTNVAFLKPLAIQTRKSRQLKKWLTLIARMLAITCIVLAFAQPYIPGSDTATQGKQTAIYLDNSYSMQAQGSNGPLYQSAVTQLLQALPNDKKITLFTNDRIYKQATKSEFSNELLQSDYSHVPFDLDRVLLTSGSLSRDDNAVKELVVISDFQNTKLSDSTNLEQTSLVQLSPQVVKNVSIDSIYMSSRSSSDLTIEVLLSSNYSTPDQVTVSLENDNLLIAKTSTSLIDNKGSAQFQVPATTNLNGKIFIEDQGLQYDNELFISSNAARKIKILSINNSESGFLERIYDDPAFDYQQARATELNYNLIKEQNLIILNEVVNYSGSLVKELQNFKKNGGTLVIIPTAGSQGLNTLINVASIQSKTNEKKITDINFEHPLLKGVFNKRVTSFQYPNVKSTLWNTSPSGSVLNYEDGRSFLYELDGDYYFTAALNAANTNFKNSPLIVPIFYNIAINSLPLSGLYQVVGSNEEVAVPVSLLDDQVIKISRDGEIFIPRQQSYKNYVLVQAGNDLEKAGNYDLLQDQKQIGTIAFNTTRTESDLDYAILANQSKNLYSSIQEVINDLNKASSILSLWKYFVIGALLFLICEILILKFVK